MTTQQIADDRTVQKSKTVNIVAYLNTPEDGDKYERVARLFEDERVTETVAEKRTDWAFVSDGRTMSVRNTVAEKMMDDGASFEDGYFKDRGDTYERRIVSLDERVFSIALDSFSDIRHGVSGGYYNSGTTDNSIIVRKPDYTRVMRVTGDFSDDMGLLKHMSQMSPGDRYEDEEVDLDAATFTVDIKEQGLDSYLYLSDVVVPRFVEVIASDERVARIRVQECEETTTEEGVCFGI